jgi:hypothetical protein
MECPRRGPGPAQVTTCDALWMIRSIGFMRFPGSDAPPGSADGMSCDAE